MDRLNLLTQHSRWQLARILRYLKNASFGQAMDAAVVHTMDEYEHMPEYKASALVVTLTESIAIVDEAETNLRCYLTHFGNEFGIVVQIINDHLGGWKPDTIAKGQSIGELIQMAGHKMIVL